MIFLTALALLSVFVLPACATSPATTPVPTTATVPKASTTAPATAPTPQYGGVLKIISAPGIQNMGYPGKAFFAGDQGLGRPSVQFILSRDPKTLVYIGELVTSYNFSSDYKSVTLMLKKGVKFQDGTDFNADAAISNLNLHWKGIRSDFKSVTSIDKLDDYTVRLNLSGYDAKLLNGLASLSGTMVSPTSLQKLGDAAKFNPVGTGPYKFVSYQTDVSLKYESFDGFSGGKPYLDGIEFNFIKDPVTQLSSFKAGEAQVMRSVDIIGAVDLQAAGKDKYNIIGSPGSVFGIASDGGHPDSVFADIKVRRAIAYAIDKEAIAKALGKGFYKATNQWSNPETGGLTYNPNIVGYAYDPAKAKQLLSEAGYPNGFETKIVLQNNTTQIDMMTMVQGHLAKVGIAAKLDVADTARFNEIANKGWSNALIYYWMSAAPGIDAATSVSTKMCSKATHYDPKSVLIPADFDAKYWVAAAEPDPAKARVLFQEIAKMAIDDYCIATPFYVGYNFVATTPKVHNYDWGTYGVNEWRPENAWLSK